MYIRKKQHETKKKENEKVESKNVWSQKNKDKLRIIFDKIIVHKSLNFIFLFI
jgi:hypothetical protein